MTQQLEYDILREALARPSVLLSVCREHSNLNKGTGYVNRTASMNSYIGKTVTVKFLGVEDSSLATSFRIDDTALTTS